MSAQRDDKGGKRVPQSTLRKKPVGGRTLSGGSALIMRDALRRRQLVWQCGPEKGETSVDREK